MAARSELDATRRAAAAADAQAKRAAESAAEDRRTAEEQRQRAEGLSHDLVAALHEMQDLQAKAAGAIRSKAAALRARHAAEASLAAARRALDDERQKLEAYEHDIALTRQSTGSLKALVDQGAAERDAAVEARKFAEAAAKQAGAALALEREKRRSLARDLDTARQERDSAKEELSRVSAAQRKALGDERERANGRKLRAAKENDSPNARTERRILDVEQVAKSRAGGRASERARKHSVKTSARSAREPALREVRRMKVRKPTPPARPLTIVLPYALLPKERLVNGLW
ncbi:hypothetical protein ILFOPFJJ_00260 [Ensifer psoraleae]|nr:hypothetical protein [Sinorhizobium psoraleae]